MFIVTYGFGDSVDKLPTLGFFIGQSADFIMIDIEFNSPIKRSISFDSSIKRTMNFDGNLS